MRFRESKVKHYYELELRLDVSSISESAKELMDSLNETMHSFGFNENASLMSGPIAVQITSNKALTADQLATLRNMYAKEVRKAFKKYKVSISNIQYIGVNT